MKTVIPIYVRSKKSYFCPVCDKSITRRQKSHFLCNAKFDWSAVKVQGHKIDLFDHLRIDALKTENIAQATGYSYKHTQHVLGGMLGINPSIRDYLITHLETQIQELREVRRKLIEIQKLGD